MGSSVGRFCGLLLFGLTSSIVCSPAEEPADASPTEVARAVDVLAKWHGENREGESRVLHLVYWTPSDRKPVARYRERLSGIMRHIRDFYAGEMERLGLGERSFNLEEDRDGLLRIHLVRGEAPYADYAVESGGRIKTECLPVLEENGIDPERETIMIFCNLATWDGEKREFRHKSPYYASGGPRNGTAWQLDTPTISIEQLSLKEPIINDGQYGDIPLGKHNSIFIGGIAHELGHALGLPHCRETPGQKNTLGTALMGSGNRTYGDELRGEGKGSFLTLAHALRLASHPQFSGSARGLNLPATTKIEDLSLSVAGSQIAVRGRIESSIPVYAVVAYFDPAGGGDYNAFTATAIPDGKGAFQLHSPALTPETSGELRLFPLLVNGMIARGGMSRTPFRYPYEVDGAGTPDLSHYEFGQQLAPLLEALAKGEKDSIREEKEALSRSPDPLLREIAASVTGNGEPSLPSPGKLSADLTEVALSDCTAEAVSVGWATPSVNRLPGPPFVLQSAGALYAAGIYAHAPAVHRWKLEGRWKRISGRAGLADHKGGSVVFSIHVDGKEKWRSRTMRAGERSQYRVDLEGAGEIELRVEDGGDGNGADWGLWLDPVLTR